MPADNTLEAWAKGYKQERQYRAVERGLEEWQSDKLISTTASWLFHRLPDGTLFEDRTMAVALGHTLQSFTHISNVDETLLDKRVWLDIVPGLSSGDFFALGFVTRRRVVFVSGVDNICISERLDVVVVLGVFVR
jgi:hypothetical protein